MIIIGYENENLPVHLCCIKSQQSVNFHEVGLFGCAAERLCDKDDTLLRGCIFVWLLKPT